MIRVEDLSEVGYGGLVTGMEAWDAKRVQAGTLLPKDVVKSAKFWGYLGPGVAATVMQALGKRQIEPITERVMHGFMYGLPSFVMQLVETLKPETSSRAGASAVAQARQILDQRNAGLAASRAAGLLGAGNSTLVRPGAFANPSIYVQDEQIMS